MPLLPLNLRLAWLFSLALIAVFGASLATAQEQEQQQEAGLRGLTMEEAAAIDDPEAPTPDEAIRVLRGGNARFFTGNATRPEVNAFNRRTQILTQSPFAVVLGCSDSRVPIEIVFDQSLGDIFAVRVAGNVVEPATAGSIEYAVEHLESQVVVVMGHEGCGAVSAALLPMDEQENEPENVQFLLERIRPHVEEVPELQDMKAYMREAVIRNVRAQVAELRRNPVVAQAEDEGRIRVVGAYYEISSGAVDFVEE